MRSLFVPKMLAACEAAKIHGAMFSTPVAMAQGALESGWGGSGLTRQANNLFGIKAGKGWKHETLAMPTREYIAGKGWIVTVAKWRKYPCWEACVTDYAHMIATLSWFRDALNHLEDPDAFLHALLPSPRSAQWPRGKPGWATDPDYRNKVRRCAVEIQAEGGPRWGN